MATKAALTDITTVQQYCKLYTLFKERSEVVKESFSLFNIFFNQYILERKDDNGLQNSLVLYIMVNNALFCDFEYLSKGKIFFLFRYIKI